MNRILPIQGTVTVQGDAPMAEANRSQQQRFEQAMRLEPVLKERSHNPRPEGKAQSRQSQRPTDVQPLPQLHAHRPPSEEGKQVPPRRSAKGMWPDHKEITAKQLRQGSEQTDPKQVAFPPSDRQQSQSLTDNPERVTVPDISANEPAFAAHSGTDLVDAGPMEVTHNTSSVPPSRQQLENTPTTAQDNEQRPPTLTITGNLTALRPTNTSSDTISTHANESLAITGHVGINVTAQPASMQSDPETSLLESSADLGLTAITQPYYHVAQVTPTERKWLDEQRPVINEHEAANANSINVIANTAPRLVLLIPDSEAITPKLAPALLTELGELAAQLDAERQPLMALKPVTTGESASQSELFANPTMWVAPLAVTPGDLLLARMAPAEHHRELGQLLERLAVDIYQELGRPERPPLLRLTLPALGELAIRIEHHYGEMQIEILATTQGELLLNQGRSELIDRLQRLHPGERVTLDLFSQPDRDQGSRQQRSIYDEWEADA